MNKKGFTLIELLSVIVLLGIVFTIAGVSIGKGSENAKIQLYNSKIKNYQKAAVLYVQDNKASWITVTNDQGLCKNIEDCYYYSSSGTDITYITLEDLINNDYIKCDEGTIDNNTCIITNPKDKTSMDLETTKFIVYKKYRKIYASFK